MTSLAGAPNIEPRILITLRMLLSSPERLLQDANGMLQFNLAPFRKMTRREIRASVRSTMERAAKLAGDGNGSLDASIDLKVFTDDMVRLISDPELSQDALGQIIYALADYRASAKAIGGQKFWPGMERFPDYDIAQQQAVVRYGIVELRALENFLLAPDTQRAAIERIARYQHDEAKMYAPANASGYLAADDFEWNLRRLMTNAGFYIGNDPASAWETLKDWATRYASGLCHSRLSWHNGAAYYYLKVQRDLHEKFGAVPSYVRAPDVRKIYSSFKGKEILFVSPLAHIVQEQVSSGRLRHLYKGFEVPELSLRAIPAWISTWPNRPHAQWSETFERMCDSVEAAFRAKPFEAFIAACGSYGIPICEFVRARYGCRVLYVGNIAHTLFGVRPGAQPDSDDGINPEMWVKSDLGRYANVDRIDGGRYV